MIKFDFQSKAGTLYCYFPARMDTPASIEIMDLFNEKLTEIMDNTPMEEPESVTAGPGNMKIVFDLNGVDYICSAFLRLCIVAGKSVEKGCFTVVNTEPNVLKVFKTAGLDTLFSIR